MIISPASPTDPTDRIAVADADPWFIDLIDASDHAEWWAEQCTEMHQAVADQKAAAANAALARYRQVQVADATRQSQPGPVVYRPVSGLSMGDLDAAIAHAIATPDPEAPPVDPTALGAQLALFRAGLDAHHGRGRGWPAVSLSVTELEALEAAKYAETLQSVIGMDAALDVVDAALPPSAPAPIVAPQPTAPGQAAPVRTPGRSSDLR